MHCYNRLYPYNKSAIDPSFVLNDFFNVAGRIQMDDDDDQGSEILSSYVMPDLIALSGLHFCGASDVQRPAIQTIEELSLMSWAGGTADLSALVETGSVRIEGPWEYDSLLRVIMTLLILVHSINCELNMDDIYNTDSDAAVSVNLPVLESATYG
ncbi:uncharacterized protein DSM5745_09597 [Aspergillus mulundensis]|uniref:Uncharacterized protein n=1 Tax=Aspergillus mulundensis TaxID=1810919 RepID=A0A3D8QVX9_9EURO|nr:hypothetical protein DSM5745_09597 [Aspergillus mulundensis]RDW65858.1 hypothetical protein DSM5745_09597 [Aspergillus mulundensis]